MFWCLGSLRKHRATCVVCPQRPDAQRVRIEERRQTRQERAEEKNAAREGRGSRVYLRRCLFRIRQQERHQILISRGQSFRCARLARGLAALEASKSSAGFTPFEGQGNLQKDHDRVSYRARAVCFLSLAPPRRFPHMSHPCHNPHSSHIPSYRVSYRCELKLVMREEFDPLTDDALVLGVSPEPWDLDGNLWGSNGTRQQQTRPRGGKSEHS